MTKKDRKIIVYLAFFLLFLLAVLIGNYFQIQVIQGEKWEKRANLQHYFIVREPFRRGTFFSSVAKRKHHREDTIPLVYDVEKYHLFIDPLSIPKFHRKKVADLLIEGLSLTPDKEPQCRKQFEFKSRSRKVAMWLNKEKCEAIKKLWFPYAKTHGLPKNAVYFVSDYQRSYPFGSLLGPVLHTIQWQKNEKTRQALPTGGLELAMDAYLKGVEGKRRMSRSPRHAMEMGEIIQVPKDGSEITLTIDANIQAIAEEEIAKGVKAAKAKAGWTIVMAPSTGEILAIAQYPFFDLSRYPDYFNSLETIEHTKVHAITDANEPGSVMKALIGLIALVANEELKKRGEAPLFDLEAKMPVRDGRFPGRSKPIGDVHPYDYLNFDMAMQHSSNIYFGRIVERIINRLGKEWFRKQLTELLGFSKKTGIELPAESAGVVPEIGKLHPNGKPEWSKPTPFSIAMGHNIQVTSMQLAKAYSLLANRGKPVRPTLIKKITQGNEVLFEMKKEQAVDPVVDPALVERVVQAMRFVTKPGGTSRRADIPGYTEAGKSGTSNKIEHGVYSAKQYVSSFIGFTPVINPELVILVSMNEPLYGYLPGIGKNHHGGTCSAPVFHAIASRVLPYLGIPPDDPGGYLGGDPRKNEAKELWFQERLRLQEKCESWNNCAK